MMRVSKSNKFIEVGYGVGWYDQLHLHINGSLCVWLVRTIFS